MDFSESSESAESSWKWDRGPEGGDPFRAPLPQTNRQHKRPGRAPKAPQGGPGATVGAFQRPLGLQGRLAQGYLSFWPVLGGSPGARNGSGKKSSQNHCIFTVSREKVSITYDANHCIFRVDRKHVVRIHRDYAVAKGLTPIGGRLRKHLRPGEGPGGQDKRLNKS